MVPGNTCRTENSYAVTFREHEPSGVAVSHLLPDAPYTTTTAVWVTCGTHLRGFLERTDVAVNAANVEEYKGDLDPETRLAQGHGEMRFTNGKTYRGGFVKGQPHGRGMLSSGAGPGVTFIGEMASGKPNGRGIFRAAEDGTCYDGCWKNGMKHGKGTYRFPDGAVYFGEYEEDSRCGQGMLHYANGAQYVGGWKKGLKHGKGTLHFTTPKGERSRYVGEYHMDEQHGKGQMIIADAVRYDGDWKHGKFCGKGWYQWPDGARYEGEFQDNLRHGNGCMTYPNGAVVQGEWRFGCMTYPNRSVAQGRVGKR